MYLLNRYYTILHINHNVFTFHYVSIKSDMGGTDKIGQADLHSTMYLLNRWGKSTENSVPEFTFHYVSIKSA